MPMSSFTIGLLVGASGGGAPEAYATTGVASTRVRRGRRGSRGLLPLIEDQRGPAANGAVLAQVEERQTRGGERVLVGAPGEARAQVSLAAREGLADAACDEQALGVDAVHDDGESRGEGFGGLGHHGFRRGIATVGELEESGGVHGAPEPSRGFARQIRPRPPPKPPAPRWSRPSSTMPPPTPVPTASSTKDFAPRPAPQRPSASASALTSLSTKAGAPATSARSLAMGTPTSSGT